MPSGRNARDSGSKGCLTKTESPWEGARESKNEEPELKLP